MPRSKVPPASQPIVSALPRAAELLSVDPDRLARAVQAARLDPWGCHADGSPVYRWGRLVGLAVELGATPPPRLWRDHQWSYEASARGRAARYSQELET